LAGVFAVDSVGYFKLASFDLILPPSFIPPASPFISFLTGSYASVVSILSFYFFSRVGLLAGSGFLPIVFF
jgi:hypothetical protein